MEAKSLLYFDEMIVPKIITWIYWAEICVISFMALVNLVFNFDAVSIVTTLVGVPLAMLGARVFCELVIVIFKIHETLKINSQK